MVIPTTGYYLVNASVEWNANGTGERKMKIVKNAALDVVIESKFRAQSAGNTYLVNSTVLYLTAADYLQMQVYQDSGGNLQWIGGGTTNNCFLAVTFLGA